MSIFIVLTGCTYSTSIKDAVETGDLGEVKFYLVNKSLLHKRDENGSTILHLATEKGRTEIVNYLLSNGANPDAKDRNGDTPLQFAAYEGYMDIMIQLINSEANINTVNSYGVTPLLNALYNEKYKIARVLVLKGANVNFKSRNGSPALHVAAKSGNLEFVQFLILHGADVHAKGQFGAEALHFASEYGNMEVLKYLVSKDADVNARDTYGRTPLHEAILKNNFEVVKYLILSGANYKAEDLYGKTPLKLAKNSRNKDIEYFMANLSFKDEKYKTSTSDPKKNYSSSRPSELPAPSISEITSKIDFGKYYALVIGNNNYQNLPKLVSAKNDAQEVAKTLKNLYGFSVELLIDASRADILLALRDLRNNLADQDNLLIYYAGHGWLDKEADEGYWLPINAEKDNMINWISNSSITATLRAIRGKHVLIVADSCYSGKLARGIRTVDRRPGYISRLSQKRARCVISSGGIEPVIDSGGKGLHSVFASAFLDALEENKEIMDGVQLFNKLRRPVMLNSDQTPEYSDIRRAGHEGGEFLFVRKK
jgi:ankyrin repeat protein